MLELHRCCGRQVVAHLELSANIRMQSRTQTKHQLFMVAHYSNGSTNFLQPQTRGASLLSSHSAAIGTTACVLPTETLATLDTCLTYDDLPDTLSLNKSLAKEASCSVLLARA